LKGEEGILLSARPSSPNDDSLAVPPKAKNALNPPFGELVAHSGRYPSTIHVPDVIDATRCGSSASVAVLLLLVVTVLTADTIGRRFVAVTLPFTVTFPENV
jgi:hypothetical protein